MSPASLVMAGVTKGSRVVLEDLLGQGKTECAGMIWSGLINQVQVLLWSGLERLGQSQCQVRVLTVEDPGGLILHLLVEQKARGSF